MNLGLLNTAMLLGLISAGVPVLIHLLNRRRDTIIDWGAMQFLELGRKARHKIKLTELLLMLSRVTVLAAVAFALCRPYLGGGLGSLMPTAIAGPNPSARDVVVVIDNSASMGRRLERGDGETSPKAEAIAWAKGFNSRLESRDSLAIVVAGDRVRVLIEPSFDRAKVAEALDQLVKRPARGSSDIPAALGEAFRVLDKTKNPERDVIILSDNQRLPWRAGEPARWALIREFQKRASVAPRVWSLGFEPKPVSDSETVEANGAIGPLSLSLGLVTPATPLKVSAELTNLGPGPLSRPAELWVDGDLVPGSSQKGEPLPEGGKTTLSFKTTLNDPGSHVVSIKLGGVSDALPGDDESSSVVEVTDAFGVLLVEGEPGLEPLGSETDFLRAALAPSGDDTPQAKAKVIKPEELTSAALQGQSVLVLANLDRIGFDQGPAISRFLEAGGGVLVAPGDRVDLASYNTLGWLPAKLGERTGDFIAKKVVAHPNPSTFSGPVLAMFGPSQGSGVADDTPVLGRAGLFAYFRLEPTADGVVSARLDTGEPWAVERTVGKGRVLLLAGPLDAEGGTLPVNPDFVPLIHEWTFHLAGGSQSRAVKPGEPLVFNLKPDIPADISSLPILTPDGTEAKAPITRNAGVARARYEDTTETGVYRLRLPGTAKSYAYGIVNGESRESDLSPLDPAETEKLAEGWPMVFENDSAKLADRVFSGDGQPGSRNEIWRALILLAMAGLCVEIYLTRRLVRGQGLEVS